MKILLVNPKHPYHSSDAGLNHMMEMIRPRMSVKLPSLALLTVAALTPAHIEIGYVDENIEAIDFDAKVDLVGITLLTPQATRAYEIADEFHKRNKTVVMGGTHVTSLPDEAATKADAVVIGEAESVWPSLLEDFQIGRLKKYYRGSWVPMTEVPMARLDLLKGFFEDNDSQFLIPLEISRGCPVDCSFCSVTAQSGAKMRLKSPQQVVEEVEQSLSVFPREKLIFKLNDPNPFVNRRAMAAVLKALAPLKIRWNSYADISVSQFPDLLKVMKGSGCDVVAIGLESLTSQTMREFSIWKSKYVDEYRERLKIINDHGIVAVANFILTDQENMAPVMEEILEFIDATKLLCNFTILTPFPGTRLFDEMKTNRQLKKNTPWRDYNNLNVVFKTQWDEANIYDGMTQLHQKVWQSPLFQKINQNMSQIFSQ